MTAIRTAIVVAATLTLTGPAFALPPPGGGAWDDSRAGEPINPTGAVAPDLANYRLTFDDEFDQSDIVCYPWKPAGQHRWYIQDGATLGVALSQCSKPYGDNVSVNDGVLALTAVRHNGVWTTGAVRTRDPSGEGFSQKYGYFEARIKLPPPPLPGVDFWPAFWFVTSWAPHQSIDGTEVDILESWSRSSHGLNQVSIHAWPAKTPDNDVPTHQQASKQTPVPVFDGAWHVWGLKYTPTAWTVYLDGRVQMTYPITGRADYMRLPIHPILDLAVKSDDKSSTNDAAYSMYVDWVRIYACASPACQD
ncbi:MAG TPA: glycoside hydrolase family 16 protein [Caulobacteraceae bacterium]|nr:glycoside hydrolase family 16 protein [Caulobacteraceae bacterium]